jgi:ADP-heptose:LPS heptosyltransferase/glycosyltransferase involved in cell wall biosynthesis
VELWGLGDLAIATPFLKCACGKYKVTLLAKPYAQDLSTRLWPEVRVVPFVAPWTAFRHKYRLLTWPWGKLFHLRKLRDQRFDFGVSARWDPRDHLLLWGLRVHKRLGFPRLGSRILLTDPLVRPTPLAHKYEYWKTVGQALELQLPAQSKIAAPKLNHAGGLVIHTGAGQQVRVWPLERYRKLVSHLRNQHYRVNVLCDPEQQEWWRANGEVEAATPATVADLVPLIEGADALIGNDSGPGHLAAALGVPTFTLFGPQLPERFAPLHPSASWLRGAPCIYKPCSDYCRFAEPKCIHALDEALVCSEVSSFVAKHAGKPAGMLTQRPIRPRVSEKPPLKLAISILCENPQRRTGLSTLFPSFIEEALRLFPQVSWLVFAGHNQPWSVVDERIEVIRRFPANDHLLLRLRADHFQVPTEAARRGAAALLTVGFHPLRAAALPVMMHVFTVHHLRRGGGLRWTYRRWATKYGLKRAKLVISNSQWAASQLAVDPGRVLVSYEGLQHELFRPDGPAGTPGLPTTYLLWAANFYPYKRAELVLAAYARLPAKLRARFPLVLVGGDWNGGRGRAEVLVEQLGLRSDVHFLGWVADEVLPAIYRGARAHVLSTAEETFGRTALEAIACGCPCVLQDLPVLREVTSGHSLFVRFEDAGAASAALERICTDDGLFHDLRAAGLKRAEDFSFARLARERVEAILSALGH